MSKAVLLSKDVYSIVEKNKKDFSTFYEDFCYRFCEYS